MTNIIVRVSGGIVQEVFTELPGFDVMVIDEDVESCDQNEVIEINEKEFYVYSGDVQTYDPDKVKDIIRQMKNEAEAEYYVFGGAFAKNYYNIDFEQLYKEIEENYHLHTFALHKYTPASKISEVIADAEGWDGTAQVTREEWYRLNELQETMQHESNSGSEDKSS